MRESIEYPWAIPWLSYSPIPEMNSAIRGSGSFMHCFPRCWPRHTDIPQLRAFGAPPRHRRRQRFPRGSLAPFRAPFLRSARCLPAPLRSIATPNCLAAVRFHHVLQRPPAAAHHRVIHDGQRIFAPRIVRSKHNKIAAAARSLAHQGRFARSLSPPQPNNVITFPLRPLDSQILVPMPLSFETHRQCGHNPRRL